ncbi:MAG TPA: GspE/PulE family protein, partial [Candidatus Nitrosotenuis sp.]|nr:GspE/PulE family protein [Candidatus Nitrosotenuis sp.]
DIEPVLAHPRDIKAAIERVYRQDAMLMQELEATLEVAREAPAEPEDRQIEGDSAIGRLTAAILNEGIERKASDIHFEPLEGRAVVRYRIDGSLVHARTLARQLLPPIVARLKVLAQLRIEEKRLPQDGRMKWKHRGRELDFRVATLPTVNGESAVLRVLDREGVRVDLDSLGFEERDLVLWKKLVQRPHGIVLVTGPTGSGKSTTLYATLHLLNKPDVKILTVEDPVEYNLDGVMQVQTHPQSGLTFARALRSFLRQDPDVVMLGEIRDQETGTIAFEAALTGHLVLSTLHTNSAVASLVRLEDMGLEPFLVSSTLGGVLAQRLVRKVCQRCAVPVEPTAELAAIFEQHGLDPARARLRRGKGCLFCGGLGYQGRTGIYELFECTEAMRQKIARRAPQHELFAEAQESGMSTLFQSGLRRVHDGTTTYEELITAVSD